MLDWLEVYMLMMYVVGIRKKVKSFWLSYEKVPMKGFRNLSEKDLRWFF